MASMPTLIAPDKFKGTLAAREVAEAIAAGIDGETDLCPLADGGEGTAEALLGALGGGWLERRASDPLGRPVDCRFALLGNGEAAAIDVAEASGLWRLEADERDPVEASTAGTGELIAAAIDAGAKTIYLGCGGSASTDAGVGALAQFDPSAAEIVCLCDTKLSFDSAATVFAVQKGADQAIVEGLSARLAQLAADLPNDPSRLPFTAAAGGLAGGLWAHGARLESGPRRILALLDFARRLARADLVITGEGRLDETSLRGKVVGEVAERAAESGTPCWAIVGQSTLVPARARAAGLAGWLEAGDLGAITSAATVIAGWQIRSSHERSTDA